MDSLKSAVQTSKGKERAERLLDLSRLTRRNNVDSAIIQAQEALSISLRIDDKDQQSKSLLRLGFYYLSADRDTLALEYLMSALKLDRQRGDRAAEADALHLLGRFYMGQANDTLALDYLFMALEIREDENLKDEAGITLTYIGDVYLFRNETEQAVYFFRRATELAIETKDLKQITIAGVKAGNNLYLLDQKEKADCYFNLALEAARNIPSIHAEAGIVSVMSAAYQDKMLYDKALKLNQDFLNTAIDQENKILQARSYENLAGIYAALDQLDRSAGNLMQAFQIFRSMHFPISQVVDQLMNVYLELGMPDSAIHIGKKAVNQMGASDDLKGRQKLMEGLIAAYQVKGDYIQLARSQNELLRLNEVIYDEEKTRQISEMEVRYKTEQKAQAITMLKNEQAKADLLRNGLLTGLGLLVVIGLLIFNRQRLRIAKNKTDLENVRLKQQQLRQDLEFKNRQLTTHSLHLVQKNKIMLDLKTSISNFQKSQNGESSKQLRNLQHMIDHSFNLDQDWEEFKMHFEAVHKGFFKALKRHAPELTINELRLSALVKLNLNIKEAATILNISPDSVKTARYRLRKKLNLKSDQDLSGFLMDVEQQVMS